MSKFLTIISSHAVMFADFHLMLIISEETRNLFHHLNIAAEKVIFCELKVYERRCCLFYGYESKCCPSAAGFFQLLAGLLLIRNCIYLCLWNSMATMDTTLVSKIKENA